METCKKFMQIFVPLSEKVDFGKMIPIRPDPVFRSTTLGVDPSTALCNFLKVGSRKNSWDEIRDRLYTAIVYNFPERRTLQYRYCL